MVTEFAIFAIIGQAIRCELRDSYICGLRNNRGMTNERDEIRIWLRYQLKQLGRGGKARLAAALGVGSDTITRMINLDPKKETREVLAHELIRMARFFSGAPANWPPARTDDLLDALKRIEGVPPGQRKRVMDRLRALEVTIPAAEPTSTPEPDDPPPSGGTSPGGKTSKGVVNATG